jgi:hypothetical protein
MLALGGAHERKAHEGRLAKIEATGTVLLEERLKALVALGFRESAPIGPLDGNLDSIDHVLHGLYDPFPAKTAAQNRMSLGDPLPDAKEPRFVQRLVQRCDHLLDVDAGIASADGVEEHPRLHRRQFVGIDYRSHSAFAEQAKRGADGAKSVKSPPRSTDRRNDRSVPQCLRRRRFHNKAGVTATRPAGGLGPGRESHQSLALIHGRM